MNFKRLTLITSILSSLSFFTGSLTTAQFKTAAAITDNQFSAATSFPKNSLHLVINEVYYLVDPSHGLDSLKDRGNATGSGSGGNTISGNDNGSSNTITVSDSSNCSVSQSNNTTATNDISVSSSTGGNTINGNSEATASANTGSASASATVVVNGSSNNSNGCGVSNGGSSGQNDEWVELYNPTDKDIDLKDWTLTDNSGSPAKIIASNVIKAKGFVILAKNASTFARWTIPPSTLKVELGNQIGDGLDNAGDHLTLKDSGGNEVDRMSWGTDTSGFAPPATNPVVPLGNSTERLNTGLDTDTVSNWHAQNPPTPGS